MLLSGRDILDMASLSREEIRLVLDTADRMKEISERPVKKVPTLRGKSVVLFFYEPSTRTRTSFDVAAKRLSADSFSLSASTSSLSKGETLIDTARTLEAMKPDVLVLRHSSAGAPHMLASRLSAAVINAGDGMHAHPSQALLDMMTVREAKGDLRGLRLAIIGDIAHSRVARSNIVGFTKMGASVILHGPRTMIPPGIDAMGAEVAGSMKEALSGADVIMLLRLQLERQKSYLFPSEREYATIYGLSPDKLAHADKGVLIMHPGPINRGLEISPEVADGPWSLILDQVTNGVAVRMALLFLIAGGAKNADTD
jgi:aspartate carbamoyltransferase catalytic subunit